MSPHALQVLASWLIGSDPACDLVVNHPTVSGHHCRLTQYENGFVLEDLGSTNGTYVDNHRIPPRSPVAVTPQSQVTLGSLTPLPWPQQKTRPAAVREPGIISIGRAPESDIVLDFPMISWNHARISQRNGQYILQDLNSRNGTAIGEIQNRITEAALLPSDDVYFGSFKIGASRLLSGPTVVGDAAHQSVTFTRNSIVIGRDPECEHPIDHPMVSWHHARLVRGPEGVFVEDLGSLNGTFVNGMRVTGRVQVLPGQEIVLGNVGFQLLPDGSLSQRKYEGNVSIQAVDVVVSAADGKRLLDPISLTVYPSELVALMGPAGAGKTTFLKALNGYSPPSQGQVLFNGSDLYRYYDQFRQQMGYVPQDEIVHSQLTVREALYFSTKLRTDLSDKEIEARIDRILEELGILDKKNSLIGSPEHKVLSGGQRKRVNIALELISDLPVLFLDEPTSGLSSYDAEGVVDLLKRLSQQGKTIITTIHQPSTDVFRKFDNLIMISRDSGGTGALAYFGPAYPDSIKFFHNRPRSGGGTQVEGPGDKDLNPEMLLTGLASARTPEWCDRFAKSPYHQQFVQDRARQSPPSGESAAKPPRHLGLGQWLVLVRRNLVLKVRDRAQLIILLLQAPLFGVLIGLVFDLIKQPAPLNPRVPFSPGAAQAFAELGGNLSGVEFLMVVAAIWFGCNNAARDVVGEWTIFQRERMVNLKLPSYVFSKFAVLLGLCVFQCLALLAIVYFWCGLKGDFLATASVLILASLVGAALGLAISARSSTTESAIALLPVVLLPIIALGGGIRAVYKMPRPAQLLSYAVPSRWAFESNLVQEARGRPCGYLPGPAHWDSCTTGDGKGVDAATEQVPEAVAGVEGEKQPAAPKKGENLRFSFGQALAALASMAVILLGAVLGFLKIRDIH
ncbi:MAG TPA: FHA domain-containing protein [Terriglobales bacterium]|nr:FHA domain-containing protein [Terriglobales bacterium]